MSPEAIVSIIVVGILALGCIAFMYAMFNRAMEHSHSVWQTAEAVKTDVWRDSMAERRIAHNRIEILLAHNDTLLTERREELTQIRASIEKARIMLMKDVSEISGKVAKEAAEETQRIGKQS